jgi:hypothetical protein
MKHKGQIFMGEYVEKLLNTLTKELRAIYTCLRLNEEVTIDEFKAQERTKMTQAELAKHLGYSLSTFKRKCQELQELWKAYVWRGSITY